jgi:hypothetical protein
MVPAGSLAQALPEPAIQATHSKRMIHLQFMHAPHIETKKLSGKLLLPESRGH